MQCRYTAGFRCLKSTKELDSFQDLSALNHKQDTRLISPIIMADSERRANLSTKLNSLITAATADKQKVPGVVFRAVDRHGNIISSVASGLKSIAGQDPMSVDTTFWIASCTKLVSAIALMQLVERGEADLDSADQLEAIVPELRDVQILENGKLKPKINRITLRSLMTHVSDQRKSRFPPVLQNFDNTNREIRLLGLHIHFLTKRSGRII